MIVQPARATRGNGESTAAGRTRPHRQSLVHDVHIGVEVGEEREGEPHEHPRGVLADRLVDELADLGELEDGGQAVTHVPAPGKPRSCALWKTFCRPVSRAEPRAELQQGHHAPSHLERSGCGIEGPGEDLQQRALPGAVDADDSQAFARAHFEGDVAQRPEVLVPAQVAEGDPLEQAVPGLE